MISARAIYRDIRNNDAIFGLFCSVAASGEAQGGWENGRIAELTRDPELREKISRHSEDEDKYGRLFAALLRKRRLEACEVPDAANYTMLLERCGIGLPHARLRRDEPLSDEELLRYLVHSRVTEQRAHEEVEQQRRIFADDPELGRAVRMIADDEVNHLSYTREELGRFSARGYRDRIRAMLREYALVEIAAYRDVSLVVVERVGAVLGWSRAKRAALRLGIHAIYAIERLWTWRRMATVEPPERPGALSRRARHQTAATA
ncbi:MAG TPA: ferritin-like domain-containing protein [Myxococcota bacterium]|nr:ferritin-like domain-containing protein [Myxococcota bacterium]